MVVGCGISGLSSGLLLAKAGFEVNIISKTLPPNTTSNKAAAFWSPYYVSGNRIADWAKESYFEFERLSRVPESGVSMTKLHRFRKKNSKEADNWEAAIPEGRLHALKKEALLPEYDEGFEVEVPLIETQIFLPYLMNEFRKAGGKIFQREVKSLDELLVDDAIVINCSGMEARTLVNDTAMIPVKGQVVMVDIHFDIPIILDESEPTYIVQRKDGCIIGGTREENVFSETTDEATISNILDRASKFLPELKSAKRISQWAGLRPYRYEVRLERETLPEGRGNIIHNYGHGGSGFTLAWGCAKEVRTLVELISSGN